MVKSVLTKHGDTLKNLLEDSIEDFASKMHKEGLIGDSISRNPTHSKIINQLLYGMSFMEQKSEIEAHCSALLKVLYDMGGPFTKFGMKIQKQLVQEAEGQLKLKLIVAEKS